MKILQLPSFLIQSLFLIAQGKRIKYSLQVDRQTKTNDPTIHRNKKQKRLLTLDHNFDDKFDIGFGSDKSQVLTNVITIISDIPIHLEPKKNMEWISMISE